MGSEAIKPLSIPEAKARLLEVTGRHTFALWLKRHAVEVTMTGLVAGLLIGIAGGARNLVGKGFLPSLVKRGIVASLF
jgi:hypothetical protein